MWQLLFGEREDPVTPARTVVNKAAVVGSFAQDCVSMWLTATSQDTGSLAQCFALPTNDLKLPSTPAVVITTPTIVAVTYEGLAGKEADSEIYSVVVGVTERPYESAPPTRGLYRVPVLWSKYGPRAASLPARVSGPGQGADLPLSYPTTLTAADPAFQVVSGFVTAFLTGSGGLERYVTADSLLASLGQVYETATVTGLTATQPLPTTPADGQAVRVLAQVSAVTSQYAPVQLVYPLTLRGLGGRWSVAGIDPAPAISQTDAPIPVATGTAPS
ncbi:conjugal transfer protein [Mycolicibacterium goodii]|uniref:conjugal transfer protein n=1 Tax=Mycolicibacterium goodii TaxID=134601 RepID=UPI0027E083E6|nr:conjugal transfer protein [Mycolicibacterium goodii]